MDFCIVGEAFGCANQMNWLVFFSSLWWIDFILLVVRQWFGGQSKRLWMDGVKR